MKTYLFVLRIIISKYFDYIGHIISSCLRNTQLVLHHFFLLFSSILELTYTNEWNKIRIRKSMLVKIIVLWAWCACQNCWHFCVWNETKQGPISGEFNTFVKEIYRENSRLTSRNDQCQPINYTALTRSPNPVIIGGPALDRCWPTSSQFFYIFVNHLNFLQTEMCVCKYQGDPTVCVPAIPGTLYYD